MNETRRSSWILLGVLALAAATALTVLTLQPSTPPSSGARAPAPRHAAGSTDREAERGAPTDGGARETDRRAPDAVAPHALTPGVDPARPALRGEVRAARGGAIASAEIAITLVEPDGARELGAARSDASGVFRAQLDALSELDATRRGVSHLAVHVRAAGYQPQSRDVSLRAAAADSNGWRADFTLTAGNALRGRVVDRTGRPVGGADVELVVHAADTARTKKSVCARDRTAADGRFALGFVSSGAYELSARESNTGTAWQEALELTADADRTLPDVVLHGDGVLAGRARYAGGAPARALDLWAVPDWLANEPNALAQAALQAADLERDDGLLYAQCRTDVDGRFRFAGLKPGNYVVRSPRTAIVLEPRQARYVLGTDNLAIEVQTYRLLVRVQDSAGRPLAGAVVACAEMTQAEDGHLETYKVDRAAATGADATAAFEAEPDRTYALTASAPGSRSAEDLAILAPGEYEHATDLVLQPLSAHGRVHVTLDGAGRESAAALEIALYSALTEQRVEDAGVLRPDPDGWLPPIAPGRYRLQVGFGARDGELSMYFPIPTRQEVEVRADQVSEYVVHARAGARIRLALDVATPAKPASTAAASDKQRARDLRERGATASVACDASSGARPVQFVEPAPQNPKRFLLESHMLPGESALIADLLEPGACTLHVEAPGFEPAEAHVDLHPGEVQDLRVTLHAR
jgi:protocatechuate 3,4-dioxygenase beta subunit